MNTVDGLRDGLVGPRLRRLRDAPGPVDATAGPVARWHRDLPRRRRLGGRRAGRAVAASGAAAPGRPTRGAGLVGARGHRARVHRLRDSYEEAWRKRYRDLNPANLYNVDYSLLGDLPRRAAAGPDPPLDGRRRHGGRVGPRASATSASTRSPSGTRTRCDKCRRARRCTRSARRRSPPRRAWRSPSWRSTTSARATRATSTSRCDDEDGGPLFADDRDGLRIRAFLAGQLAYLRELTLFLAPNINSYKRFAAGSFAPTARRVGARQPHVLAAGGRPRRTALRFESRVARRGPQPVPRAQRASSPPGCTASIAASRSRSPTPETRTSRPTGRGCPRRSGRPVSCSRRARSPEARSETRSSTTTSTPPTSSSPRSSRR